MTFPGVSAEEEGLVYNYQQEQNLHNCLNPADKTFEGIHSQRCIDFTIAESKRCSSRCKVFVILFHKIEVL